MFNKVAFIGLGLLGGSIAQRIKEVSPKTIISAMARSTETTAYALKNDFIDEASTEAEMVVSDADLVIIATPITAISKYVATIHAYTKKDTLIIDIASTKETICQELKKYSDKFIGGHPMCGTEKTGIKNSFAQMLDNAVFVLTPYPKTRKENLTKLTAFIKKLKMQPEIMSPKKHDEAVAAISHAPYFIATALLQLADNKEKKALAATGFKSTTRVGASDPFWGVDIAQTNKKEILNQLTLFQENIEKIKKLIKHDDQKRLLSFLKKSQNIRKDIYQ